ncbi:hypothetical protein J4219_02880 [Candidatus Woesearchaeota archaeon]|nr:hypothetical protein [Candidatus Woesearchaeota archaeon]
MKELNVAILILLLVIAVALGGLYAFSSGVSFSFNAFGKAVQKPNINYGPQKSLYGMQQVPDGACRQLDRRACPGLFVLVVNGKQLSPPGNCISTSNALTLGVPYCR